MSLRRVHPAPLGEPPAPPPSAYAGVFAAAFALRVLTLALATDTRLGSDETNYVRTGLEWAAGQGDTFWPPLVPWMVAGLHRLDITHLTLLRGLWAILDSVTAVLVVVAGRRLRLADGAALAAGFGWALYMPAAGFAVTVTTETPSALLVAALVAAPVEAATILAPLLALCRSAFTLLPGFAFAAFRPGPWAAVIVLALIGVVSPNSLLPDNGTYNFYMGNRAYAGDDLNLFMPIATSEQRAQRKAMLAGDGAEIRTDYAAMREEALAFIADHPATTLRRAVGRVARLFAPRTSALELAGGERAVGALSPTGLSLVAIPSLQFAGVLVLALFGLVLAPTDLRRWLWVVAAPVVLTVAATLGKPRYLFPVEPVLVLLAAWAWHERRHLQAVWDQHKGALSVAVALFAWVWVAWAVFAITSRG
jgi:hypothetical protein